jgi:GTP-binding protein
VFLDEADVEVKAGDGGNGAVAFRREKHVPRGGPAGGNGGDGGAVILVADGRMGTLLDFKYKHAFSAGRGVDGGGGRKDGARGDSCEIRVPCGTVVIDRETGQRLADLVAEGQRYVAAGGGKGGRGNYEFASAVRKTPRFAQKGEPGQSRKLRLELKLLADVGIVGLPNAGKSTLISAISAARPKIADYPFTTLVPNLGVVRAGETSFVVADMPGLIEGAHAGSGLGDRFLRHIERTRVLLHLVDCLPLDGSDPVANFDTVQGEIEAYGHAVAAKPMLVGLNKTDLPGAPEAAERAAETLRGRGHTVFTLSAATGARAQDLVFALAKLLEQHPRPAPEPQPEAELTSSVRPSRLPWKVERVEGRLVVSGPGIERIVAQTDLNNLEALKYLHRRLERMGVMEALRREGVEENETVMLADVELEYVETA